MINSRGVQRVKDDEAEDEDEAADEIELGREGKLPKQKGMSLISLSLRLRFKLSLYRLSL
jgi:hypothetical protein